MDSNKPTITGVKKRQQIKQANKAVFIWVAAAGIIVAIALVLAQVMVKQFIYNLGIINHQTKTNSILVKNAEMYAPLRTEVSKLIANKELSELRINKSENGDNSLQVVIDAMPTVDDRLALASSLQTAIISRSGVRVEQLSFTDTSAPGTTPVAPTVGANPGVSEIPFNVKVAGTYDQVKKLLEDMQLSIRPISVTSIKLGGDSTNITAEIGAKAYYATPPTTDLKKEKQT